MKIRGFLMALFLAPALAAGPLQPDDLTPEELIGQILAQLIISFRAASRTHQLKLTTNKPSTWQPTTWQPALAKILRSQKTTDALSLLIAKATRDAAAQGLSLADYLAAKGIPLT